MSRDALKKAVVRRSTSEPTRFFLRIASLPVWWIAVWLVYAVSNFQDSLNRTVCWAPLLKVRHCCQH